MTTEHYTPREQLQLLAESLHLSGKVQYVSTYARSSWAMEQPGWYLTTKFDRRQVIASGQYLGRRWVDAIDGLHMMGRKGK